MKLTNILLASYLALTGCNTLTQVYQQPTNIVYKETKKLKDEIGYDNIRLKNFEDLDDNIPSKKIKLPTDLEKIISNKKFKLKDEIKFSEQVYKEASKFGFTPEKIKNLTPKQTIQLIANIIRNKLDYSMKYNSDHSKTVDDLFEEGIAECNMYTQISAAIFNIFKKTNPKLTNVYMTNSFLTRISQIKHDWNTIFIYNGKTLQISYIDITWYEYSSKINAIDNKHVDLAWKGILFKKLEDYKTAIKEFQELTKCNPDDTEFQADLLFYIYSCASLNKNDDLEQEILIKLLKKYPKTIHAKVLKKYKK